VTPGEDKGKEETTYLGGLREVVVQTTDCKDGRGDSENSGDGTVCAHDAIVGLYGKE
jgi:hypothetical protein